ncbi:MAG: hemerythrin domain-containing protein [Planctomycetota bacterium]
MPRSPDRPHRPPHPVDQLAAEHRVLAAVLGAMSDEDRRLQSFDVRLDFWVAVLEWLELFADQDHHEREELVLFPELARAGLGAEHGPMQQVRVEHERARAVRGTMVQALATQDAPGLRRAAADYARQLREHIEHEERVLWPLALEVLDDAAVARVHEGFAAHAAALGDERRRRAAALQRLLVPAVGQAGG